ncbi:MAG: response regulator [Nodosilinea sp.]
MVVEEDPANRLFFSDYLTQAGFIVSPLPHSVDLDQHLKDFSPDLLVLDLGLPEFGGYTLLQKVRQSSRWRHLPVIVVSGYAFQANHHQALELGAQEYLVKPIRVKELIKTVQATLATIAYG